MNNDDAYRSPSSTIRDSYTGGAANVKPFTTKGRIGRAYYIIYSMGLGVVVQLILMIGISLLAVLPGAGMSTIAAILLIPLYIFGLVMQFIWAIRRAHDADMSGWMSLLLIVPLAILVFWFLPGTRGPNRFGPAPKRGPVWAAICLGMILPMLFFGGILAAIAIPAYQDYTLRAQVGQCMSQSAALRSDVTAYMRSNQQFPNEATVNTFMPERPVESTYCYIDLDTSNEQLVMTFKEDEPVGYALHGQQMFITFELDQGTVSTTCGSDMIEKYLPLSCRN